ncbi:DUF5103 domain-containing protein [Gaetbulibacter aquiaggeris]|uniref:DUF5103 domain-containing protein n=1 Tax=Gaetbulibacter aquiaggeris TaxID=1735373 RepID=A0ABW7MNM4_9FLAO
MRIKSYILSFFVLIIQTIYGQVEEVNPPDFIKTINFKGDTNESQLPVLKLGDYVDLEFDALNGHEDDYYYTIDYYNFDWTPSVLVKSEYLEGIDNQRIRTYWNSFNTYQIYSHYKLTIPNEQTKRLKISGNYMINIFNEDNELVFSRKFMIYESLASIGVNIKRSRDIASIDYKQRVEIAIVPNGIQLNNPKANVKIIVVQNNNLNTAINNLKPQFTIGSQLIYKYDDEASFWGGNEYLYFENKDVRGANSGIQRIELEDLYHNYLFANYPRVDKPYTYNPDINGNYVINNIDAENPDIEADYVWIHFSLLSNQTLEGKKIHVYGNFNNYAIDNSNEMIYDANDKVFKCSLLLKQGFYNYKYVVIENNNQINEGAVSGDFYQTENNYKVIAYYRDLGKRYDRIIGFGEGSSVNISN